MAVGLATGSIVATPGQSISLSSMFTVTPGAGNPTYLVVSGLDRNEYTVSATGSTGTLTGNGHSTGFTSIGGDGLGAGIVFTYNAVTGQYTNTTYGNLADVTLTASHDTNRNESISLFGTNSSASLNQYANNPYALEQFTTYLGSVSVVTHPGATTPAPTQATPSSIASAAMSYVGQAWNDSGCWVLCSNISAQAGASLPLTSTSIGIPGVASGEWIVAYNGPAGQTGDWQSMIKAGDMVAFATSASSGHITTVVSGSGSSAMLVDNITYTYSNGQIANAANDGSPNDIVIAPPHAATQEWAQAVAGSVVIYQLDTPIVAAASTSPSSVATGGTLALSGVFTTSDPGNRAITQYQVYDTGTQGAANDTFLIGGMAQSAHSAATAVTVTSANLTTAALQAASSSGVDTLQVRAYNGSYWGDWQSLTVNVGGAASSTPAPAPAPHYSAPVVASRTANQVWRAQRGVTFSIPGNTFVDPQGLGMTYAAYQVSGNGAGWLHFNGATGQFSGTPPRSAKGTIEIEVVATDSAGLSAAETFNVTIAPTAAKFAQAVASVHMGRGAAGAIAGGPAAPNTLPRLASPVA